MRTIPPTKRKYTFLRQWWRLVQFTKGNVINGSAAEQMWNPTLLALLSPTPFFFQEKKIYSIHFLLVTPKVKKWFLPFFYVEIKKVLDKVICTVYNLNGKFCLFVIKTDYYYHQLVVHFSFPSVLKIVCSNKNNKAIFLNVTYTWIYEPWKKVQFAGLIECYWHQSGKKRKTRVEERKHANLVLALREQIVNAATFFLR